MAGGRNRPARSQSARSAGGVGLAGRARDLTLESDLRPRDRIDNRATPPRLSRGEGCPAVRLEVLGSVALSAALAAELIENLPMFSSVVSVDPIGFNDKFMDCEVLNSPVMGVVNNPVEFRSGFFESSISLPDRNALPVRGSRFRIRKSDRFIGSATFRAGRRKV